MFSFLFLCSLTIYLLVNSGSPQSYEKRIVGGKHVPSTEWPMVVSIRQQNLPETLKEMKIPYISKNGHFCAGTLISPDWVVTAASCFPDKEVQQLLDEGEFTIKNVLKLRSLMRSLVARMNLRNYYICFNEQCTIWRSISNITIHPGYLIAIGSKRPAYDIALVQLEHPVEEYIPDIISTSRYLNNSFSCKTGGWGVSDIENYESSGEFREFDVKVISPKYCKPFIKPLEYCGTGNLEGNQQSAFCFFDTGGPLMCKNDSPNENWKLYGLISRDLKHDCGDRNQRGIYTNVVAYSKWINSVIA